MHRSKFWLFLPILLLLASCTTDPKKQAERYVENGNKFFEKEKFPEAAIMYRRAIQRYKLSGEAYYRLGLTGLKLAAFTDAYGNLRRAVDLQPDNMDAAVQLGNLSLAAAAQSPKQRVELLEVTKEMATKILAKDPKSSDGHRMLGLIAQLNQDPETAVKELKMAFDAKPDDPNLVLGYAESLAQNKQMAESEQFAKSYLPKLKTFAPLYDYLYVFYVTEKRLPEAEQILKSKAENNPGNATYQLQLAAHYFGTNQRPAMDAALKQLDDEKTYVNGRLLAGDFLFLRLREFDRARQEYEAGVQDFPKDKTIYQKRLVELFAATNRNNDANKLLTTILQADPADADALAMRAALRLTTGSTEEVNLAANELQSLVTKTPNNHLLRFNLARALVAKGETDQARLQLEQAIKLRPDFMAARELLAKLYLVKQDSAKALEETDAILKLDPKNLSAHLSRSSALLLLNDLPKAHQELDYIIQTYPQNAEARYQVGFLAWQEKDFNRASQVFGELHKSNPSDLRGLVGVVETLAGQNRMPQAVEEMRVAVKAEPQRRDLNIALANLLVRSERYDEAVGIYKAIIAKEPKAADVLFRLAETYRRKGDLNLAIDNFRAASQAAPNDTNALMQLGLLLDGTGRRDQAKPVYEQILKVDPNHAVALNNLAFIKAEEGVDLDQALTMAQKARQNMPNSNDVNDTLGWIYIKKNLTEDAVRTFQDLVKKAPADPNYHYHFGKALLQKGDKLAARRELEAAMKSNPSKDVATAVQGLLATL